MNSKDNSDLYSLAWMKATELTTSQLCYFIKSREQVVRTLMVQQLQARPTRDVFDIAASFVQDKKAKIRESGYLVLGQLGLRERPFKEESMSYILNGLEKEKKISVICAIAYAIGHLSPPIYSHKTIVKYFSRFLDCDKESLRNAIAFGISGLSSSSELDELIKKLLNKASQDTKEWLDISIECIQSR